MDYKYVIILTLAVTIFMFIYFYYEIYNLKEFISPVGKKYKKIVDQLNALARSNERLKNNNDSHAYTVTGAEPESSIDTYNNKHKQEPVQMQYEQPLQPQFNAGDFNPQVYEQVPEIANTNLFFDEISQLSTKKIVLPDVTLSVKKERVVEENSSTEDDSSDDSTEDDSTGESSEDDSSEEEIDISVTKRKYKTKYLESLKMDELKKLGNKEKIEFAKNIKKSDLIEELLTIKNK